MVTIYILSLEQNKYYVGRTTNITARLKHHNNNTGSAWTMKYKPISTLIVHNDCDVYDEDKYTIKMMAEYGIDNVRGGSFTQIHLSQNEIEIINKMINNACDICFNCYMSGHYITRCPYDKMENKELLFLRNKMTIMLSKYSDLNNNVAIDTLLKILPLIDPIIFDSLTFENIKVLCKKIDNIKIIGIDKLNFNNMTLNYVYFSVGVISLLDKHKKVKIHQ